MYKKFFKFYILIAIVLLSSACHSSLIKKPIVSEASTAENASTSEISPLLECSTVYGDVKIIGQLQEGYAVYQQDGLFGYANAEGKPITLAEYDEAIPFENGVGLLRKGELRGHLNADGKLVEPQYKNRYRFYENEAFVLFGDKGATITPDGTRTKEYAQASTIDGELADGSRVYRANGDNFLIQSNGQRKDLEDFFVPYRYIKGMLISGYIEKELAYKTQTFIQEYFGAVDADGKIIIPFEYEEINESNKSNLLIVVQSNRESGDDDWTPNDTRFGLCNMDGVEILPITYPRMFWSNPDRDYIIARNAENKVGVLDTEGNMVIPYLYDAISDPNNDIFRAYLSTKCGYINSKNQIIIPIEYDAFMEVWGGPPFFVHNKTIGFSTLRITYESLESGAIRHALFSYNVLTDTGEVLYQSELFSLADATKAFEFIKYLKGELGENTYPIIDKTGLEQVAIDINGEYGELGNSGKTGYAMPMYQNQPVFTAYQLPDEIDFVKIQNEN